MKYRLIFIAFLLAPMPVSAADMAMRTSLQAFLEQVEFQGAKAELAEVLRWPDTKGALHWRLPNLKQHPAHLSIVAEQRDGTRLRRWYVPIRVHWWARALVAHRDIPVRTHLSASMLELKRVDIADHAGTWWQQIGQLAGTRTTRPLHTGDLILSSYIQRPPLLKYGDQIALIANIGGIRVTATGKVLKTAGLGDRISVQNMKSKQIVQATVVDAHTAQVVVGSAG